MNEHLDILKIWERRVADPFIFEHLCELLPAWGFRRMNQGTPQDRWVSPVKMDLSKPKKKYLKKEHHPPVLCYMYNRTGRNFN